jgi:hypothetical protein
MHLCGIKLKLGEKQSVMLVTGQKNEQQLSEELNNFETIMAIVPSDDNKLAYSTVKQDLEELNIERSCGSQIHTQCEFLENNEHNSIYLFKQEKAVAESKNLSCHKFEDGTEFNDFDEILNQQKLYQEPTNVTVEEKDDAPEYFLHEQNRLLKIDEVEKVALDQEVDNNEIVDALKNFFTIKFYQFFSPTIKFYQFFGPTIK